MDTIEKALKKHAEHEAASVKDENAKADQALEADQTSSLNEPVSETQNPDLEIEPVQVKAEKKTVVSSSLPHEVKLQLDLDFLDSIGVIIPDERRSKTKEEYKHIKRPLLNKAAMEEVGLTNNNLIMVTSAYSGEGKTFSSLNLAMSVATERDRRVLLVDADVVKPGLDRLLKIDDRPGLVEYLTGDVTEFSDILLNTNVKNLSIIPAGKTHHLSHELLASKAMADLAKEMSARYPDRIIIFDSPPLLITSEAQVLSRLVGQIALVVEQDKTSQSSVLDAIALLEKDKVAGLILNKSKSSTESYYGYYYSSENE